MHLGQAIRHLSPSSCTRCIQATVKAHHLTMKFFTIVTVLAISFGVLGSPVPVESEVEVEAAASKYPKISGYNQAQSNNAWAIIGQIKKEKFGKNALVACKAAFATAITESNIYNYANKKVPDSLKYPNNGKKSDFDSVGVFQQRARYYPVNEAMNPAKSAHLFFKKMKSVKDWEKAKTAKQIGAVCQKVQGTSCTDNRYLVI